MDESKLSRDGERDPGRSNDSDPLLENQKLLDSLEGSTSEIKDEEIEASSAACCRICLEYDGEPGEFWFSLGGVYGCCFKLYG